MGYLRFWTFVKITLQKKKKKRIPAHLFFVTLVLILRASNFYFTFHIVFFLSGVCNSIAIWNSSAGNTSTPSGFNGVLSSICINPSHSLLLSPFRTRSPSSSPSPISCYLQRWHLSALLIIVGSSTLSSSLYFQNFFSVIKMILGYIK